MLEREKKIWPQFLFFLFPDKSWKLRLLRGRMRSRNGSNSNALRVHSGPSEVQSCGCAQEKYHAAHKQFSCSETKQLRVIVAIHDTNMLAEDPKGFLFAEVSSWQILRSQNLPALPPSKKLVDLGIRLPLDLFGPRFERSGSSGEEGGHVLLESDSIRKCFCIRGRQSAQLRHSCGPTKSCL